MKRARQKPKRESPPRRDDPAQSRLFIKTAREVEADEKRSAADAILGVMAKNPPKPHTKG